MVSILRHMGAATAVLLLVLLAAVAAAVYYVWTGTVEGFATKIVATPRCPAEARFFNDAKGDSFCCRGAVDPYKHTCKATGPNDLCAHKAGVPDPRNPSIVLPECSKFIERQHTEDQSQFCPAAMPHYGAIGKCCQNGTDMDNNDCIAYDNKDPKRYCKIRGPAGPNEQLCSDLKLLESTTCPSGLELIATAPAGQNARRLPVCFSVERNCVPDAVIQHAKAQGLGFENTPPKWEFSCSQYEKVHVRRDLT
jgi:hypothetical protein